ncbi:hypothetical protein BDV11DRAFT_216133 [Aspergillus similis]
MGTRGLEIVRFHKRYYIRYNQYDSYFDGLGAKIVASIPTDPEEYRAEYAARENALERLVYEIRDGVKPGYSQFRKLETLPSELPRLGNYVEYYYIINLDEEVLTMNHSIHWKLSNIPRQDDLWLRAIVDSIYRDIFTISLDVCPEEHMGSPALEIPERNKVIKYDFRMVNPRTDLAEAHKAFLTNIMARTLIQYKDEILRFGMEWSPDSFPFRELAFALVSTASSQAKFHSFPARLCHPRTCESFTCPADHLYKLPGWIGTKWTGESAPLLEFGSLSHRLGEPPGASPTETMYWFEDVLVSLALVVDGEAVTKAVTWGIEQGRTNFQIVVLSLFKASFAKVSFHDDMEPFVRVSGIVNLSPLRVDYCLSTHPRRRPELKPEMRSRHHRGDIMMNSNCTGTRRRLRSEFPGLAALVNFFEVAASRRAASKSAGILPPELYDLILDFYRLDDRMRIVAGPFVRQGNYHNWRLASFDFENIQTGEITPMYNWMPIIGHDRRALMLDVIIQFEPAGDVPVEPDSDDECALKSSCP